MIDNIINTRLEPGEKLNEPELCEQLGVSRTPFREAELELAQRRLIEIRPKIGTYVSLIDAELVEEVRHLRAVLEAEIARMACEKLTPADIDQLWENVALWRMYIERAQEEKIFELDKGFHRLLYVQCGCPYWYDLVENLAPHFDRTTILSFRCRPAKTIYEDHVSLLKAIEQKDAAAAHRIAGQHMQRIHGEPFAIRKSIPTLFQILKQPYTVQKCRIYAKRCGIFFVQFFAWKRLDRDYEMLYILVNEIYNIKAGSPNQEERWIP